MKNKIRILSVIIALLTLFAAFSLTAYATDVVDSPVDTAPPADSDTGNTTDDPNQGGTTDDPNQGGTTDDPNQGGTTDDPNQGGTTDDPNQGGTTDDPNQGDSGETTNTPSGGYVDNGDDFYYYDEDEMANSIEQSAGSVSNATKQYDTSDINEAALKESKWNDITLDVSKGTSDAMDFSAIKKNTRNNDDGQWILYLGYALIGLSVIGIMYFIIATTTYKKKLKKLTDRQHQYDTRRSRDDYGDDVYAPTTNDYTRRSRKRYAADGMGYAERKRLKADTAEINLPDKYRARH